MRVELIVVPYDSGRRGERMGAGPEHLLRAGLPGRLAQAGHEARIRVVEATASGWLGEIATAFDLASSVALTVREVSASGAFPLILSGNCGPAALGSTAGLHPSPLVFWFDAHGDFNTPETSLTGFWDGMALATLTGRCWRQLSASIPGFRPVPDSWVTMLGVRDLDPLEAAALEASTVRRIGHGELDTQLPALISAVGGEAVAYVHLDLDVLDPAEGPANTYAVPGGMRRAEIERVIRSVAATLPIRCAALTAYDPKADPSGRACDAALELGVALANAAASNRGA